MTLSEKGQLYTFGDGRHGKLAHGSDQFSNRFQPFHCNRFSSFTVKKVNNEVIFFLFLKYYFVIFLQVECHQLPSLELLVCLACEVVCLACEHVKCNNIIHDL